MDIHKPEPVHDFREFLGEITINVIGVLIALGWNRRLRLGIGITRSKTPSRGCGLIFSTPTTWHWTASL